jgi:hypothetical protein
MKTSVRKVLRSPVIRSCSIPAQRKSAQASSSRDDKSIGRARHASSHPNLARDASTLRVLNASGSSQMGRYLLRLQREYGNLYVQTVVRSARNLMDDGGIPGEIEATINRAGDADHFLNNDAKGPHQEDDKDKKATETKGLLPTMPGHPQIPSSPKRPAGEVADMRDRHARSKLERSSLKGAHGPRERISRMPETLPLPDWGHTILHNDSRMTLNPFARFTVDGKLVAVNPLLSGSNPVSFTVPRCAKTGELEIVTRGYWLQNNTYPDYEGEGTATVTTSFDVNSKGEIHLKPAIANVEAQGEIAQMTATGSAADNPPLGGSLVAQVGIAANDQHSSALQPAGLGFGASRTSGNAFSRGYRADVTMEKKTGTPVTKTQPVYYQVGKHKVIGSKDPGQPANIKAVYDFLYALPKEVRKELEDGAGSHEASIEVDGQASVTTPPHAAAGFNLELTEKRRDAVVRLVQDFLGTGTKVKGKAIGELAAQDSGESGMERVAMIKVSYVTDPCDPGSGQATDIAMGPAKKS